MIKNINLSYKKPGFHYVTISQGFQKMMAFYYSQCLREPDPHISKM